MVLETVFANLQERAELLRDCLASLRITVDEDRPSGPAIALNQRWADLVIDLLATGTTCAQLATQLNQMTQSAQVNSGQLRRILTRCNTVFNTIDTRFFDELEAHESISQLVRLGRERGGEYQAWAGAVREATRRCRQPITALQSCLFDCWREVAELGSTSSASAHAVATGQEIHVARDRPSAQETYT
jgi:hypothetical protein